jgi:hypothetical protein
MDLVDGTPIPPRKSAHLSRCERCRSEAARLSSVLAIVDDEVGNADDIEHAMLPEWSRLRDSVRNELLGRAVRRSGPVFGWPSPGWGMALAALVVVAAGAGLGSYWSPESQESGAGDLVPVETLASALFVEDPTALETEVLAWSDPEIFLSLNELTENEEEELLELLALTFGNDGI